MVETRRFRVLAARTALAALLFAGAAACGDDDKAVDETGDKGSEATDGEQAAGGDSEYCAALLEFNGAVQEIDLEGADEAAKKDAGAELVDMWAPVQEGAPDELLAQATTIGGVLDELAAGDSTSFDSDATFETYTEVLGGSADVCGFKELAVGAKEYEFVDVPETLEAGTYSLALTNEGKEPHVFLLFKKNDGETRSAEEIANLSEEEGEKAVTFAGATFAEPGANASGITTFEAGDYIFLCDIPVGGGDEGPPHYTEGMFGELTVQ